MYLDVTLTAGQASDKFKLDGDNMKTGKTARAKLNVVSGNFTLREYSPAQDEIFGTASLTTMHVLEVPVACWYDVLCVADGRIVVQQ